MPGGPAARTNSGASADKGPQGPPWPPRRIGFRVQYDGTAFHGWAAQEGLRTVQGVLVDTLRSAFDPEATVDGASRTDAGVHARGQLAACTVRHPIAPSGLVKALNSRLDGDVALLSAWEAAPDFQPRFASQGKTYRYRLYRSDPPHPLIDRFAWRVGHVLDVAAMRAAAEHLVGTHDFAAFAASDRGQITTVRTVHSIGFEEVPADGWADPWRLDLVFEGSAFLKQMVRNLTGTLVDVGRGLRPAADVPGILQSLDRRRAGQTAPARGLTLERVWYDEAALRS